MTRKLILLFLSLGFLLAGVGVAQAAPGDCLILAGEPVCEPFPTPTPAPLPYSICTPLPSSDIAPLIRKSCQVYDGVTHDPIGNPQTYIYGGEPTSSAPRSDSPSNAPVSSPSRTSSAPSQAISQPSQTSPVAPARVTVTKQGARTTIHEKPVTNVTANGKPMSTSTDALPAAGTTVEPPPFLGDTTAQAAQSVDNGVLYGIAACAALVLLLVTVVPPMVRRRGSHRA